MTFSHPKTYALKQNCRSFKTWHWTRCGITQTSSFAI